MEIPSNNNYLRSNSKGYINSLTLKQCITTFDTIWSTFYFSARSNTIDIGLPSTSFPPAPVPQPADNAPIRAGAGVQEGGGARGWEGGVGYGGKGQGGRGRARGDRGGEGVLGGFWVLFGVEGWEGAGGEGDAIGESAWKHFWFVFVDWILQQNKLVIKKILRKSH